MRASCETEWLSEGIPAHVVAGWIGHSVKVQRQSYAQITDGHFDKFNASKPSIEQDVKHDSDCDGTGQNTAEKVSHSPAKTRKTPENTGFCEDSSSGGGARTPDTRIMIPLL
jgi:hypothetical protein